MARPAPWTSLVKPDPGRDYLFLLSFLPLERARALPTFARFGVGIRRQLATTPGLIGHSMKANLRPRHFWTLSVWEGEQALAEFVRRNPHGDVMSALERDMGKTTFVRWTAPGSAVPPTWEDAFARSEAQARAGSVDAAYVSVGPADLVPVGELRGSLVRERRVAVANVDGALYAFDDLCPHLQCSLHEGALRGTTVTCPCHASDFDVTTGAVLAGPAKDPVPTFDLRVRDGELEIRTG